MTTSNFFAKTAFPYTFLERTYIQQISSEITRCSLRLPFLRILLEPDSSVGLEKFVKEYLIPYDNPVFRTFYRKFSLETFVEKYTNSVFKHGIPFYCKFCTLTIDEGCVEFFRYGSWRWPHYVCCKNCSRFIYKLRKTSDSYLLNKAINNDQLYLPINWLVTMPMVNTTKMTKKFERYVRRTSIAENDMHLLIHDYTIKMNMFQNWVFRTVLLKMPNAECDICLKKRKENVFYNANIEKKENNKRVKTSTLIHRRVPVYPGSTTR